MTDRVRLPPQATPLQLPAATLHTRASTTAHPDSEESIRYESQRVSRELSALLDHGTQNSPSLTSLRSRNAASRTTSHEYLHHQMSNASTAPDTPRADAIGMAHSVHSSLRTPHWYTPVIKFWTTHVCPVIDEGAFRDHLALERTFLGYLRTSLVLLMSGVLIAQLFRLQRAANPDPVFGFYIVGKSLSITFISMAIMVVLVGAIRFWRLQRALLRGKALAGGWEVFLVMGTCALLLVATFAVVLGVTVDKAMQGA